MQVWKEKFDEKIKTYQWKINYSYRGVLGTYMGRGENGQPHGLGVFTSWGLSIKAEWKNGETHGKGCEEENGIFQTKHSKYYEEKKGKILGKYIVRYGNGKLKEVGAYKNGKLHGKYGRYFSNGKQEEDTNYDNGLIHGKYFIYREDGTLREEGEYWNGLKVKCVNV